MGGILEEGYGAAEERREKIFRRIAIAVVVLVVGAGAAYFAFRSYPAERAVDRFLESIRNKDYQAAYRMWGCTEETPCRDYTFQMFMEDWGPKGAVGDIAAARIEPISFRTCGPGALYILKTMAAHALGEDGCFCGTGTIFKVGLGGDREVRLWYERSTKTLGFSPWPACAAPTSAFR